MSQTNQAVQVPVLPDKPKRAVPTVPPGERRTWLHLHALVYMIVLTQIPFLLAVWFSLHAWNLLVPSEGFPFVGLTNYVTEFVRDANFFFFQAEDGIRDYKVTGVQTCALPI